MKKSTLRLPKLKTRYELLRTAPELGRLLAAGDDVPALSTSTGGRAASPLAKPRSPTGKARAGSPRRLRRFSDDETTEEDRVRAELEKVKAERATLLESLSKLRNDVGKSGGELQQEDIRLLRRELEAKKEKLNELRRATHTLDESLAQLETTSRDCEQLMPQAEEALQARVTALSTELAGVEQDILEAEAKQELYKLLEIRTRRDHAASEQRMREARAMKEGASDDYTTLSKQMHEMRAAKEDAERELGGVVAMYDQVRGDWNRKLKDRRKEVRELERRKAEDEHRKQQQAALAAEKARIEQDKTAKSKSERDAVNARLSAVVPQLEALEATWARLHGICGANTAEDLIAYWQELKAKEANMRELVRLAEVREARAKQEMASLLAERAEVFDTDTARGARRQQELEQEMTPAQHPEQQATGEQQHSGAAAEQAEQQEEGQADAAAEAADAATEGPSQDDALAAAAGESAQQESGAEAAGAPTAAAAGTAPPETAVEQLLTEKQLAIAEARRRKAMAKEKFSKLSQVCVAADQGLQLLSLRLRAVMEASAAAEQARRRTTAAGGSRRVTSLHRRTTGQHQPVRRMSAAHLMEHRSSIQFLPVTDAPSPRLPQGSNIHNKDFFPELPALLHDVGGRLSRLLAAVDQLEVATAAAAETAQAAAEHQAALGRGAAAGGLEEDSSLDGSSLRASEASESGPAAAAAAAAAQTSVRVPSKKLQWADGALPEGQAGEGGEEEGGEEGSSGDATTAAAEGEKSLRKGFRRRTWAGPAWLDAVKSGKPLTASLMRKPPGSRGGVGSPSVVAGGMGGSTAALRRIVGYVEEPGSSGDEGAGGAGANPFDLGSSEDELEGEGDVVVDRQWLKHRAHKLTNPKNRGKQGAAGTGSPTIQVDTR